MTEFVHVRRQPNDYRTATYRREDVEGIHFDSTTGGINTNLSHEALCGYVWCNGMVEGDLAHSCQHGPAPHRIKIVIPKNCNDPKLWSELAGREYREPKPLDMSTEAVQRRRERAVRAASAKKAKRDAKVDSLTNLIVEKWPSGRVPSADDISLSFDVPKAVARDARRRAIAIR